MEIRGSASKRVEDDTFSLFLIKGNELVDEKHDLSWPDAYILGTKWVTPDNANQL